MVKLVRFVGLIIQSILIEFLHVFGLVAFLLAAALGYFRLPSWIVPVVGIICGVIADKFVDQTEVISLLEKAASANQRGGFLVIVYIVIVAVGYVVGAYTRQALHGRKTAQVAPPPAPKPSPAPKSQQKRNRGGSSKR
jgi:tetrahydromethanopterin S-methyltransferase subunit C